MNLRPNLIALCACLAGGLLLAGCDSGGEAAPSTADVVAATAAEHEHDAPTPTPAAEAAPAQAVLEQDLAYGEGARSNLVGFLAMPADAAEPLPGVIVIHEWWGLNDNIKAMTRRLAAEGYVALAVDLYGGQIAETPERAQELMTAFLNEPDAAERNLRQAYDYLDKYAFAPRIASIGWCLGGGWSLQTALLFPDTLDAMVMYYGQVDTNRERLATLEVPVLGFFGSEDASIPVFDVQNFRTTLGQLGKNAEVLIVPGVGHAFANPSGGNYNERAATETWTKTLEFLEHNLKLSVPSRPTQAVQ
jgi:carboxymethylenebutenolidase